MKATLGFGETCVVFAARSSGGWLHSSSSSLSLSSLELSDTTVYEPSTRALLGTASHVLHGTAFPEQMCQLWGGEEPGLPELVRLNPPLRQRKTILRLLLH